MQYKHNIGVGDLTLDAGWMWINYFNTANSLGSGLLDNDFGLQGLYFGLKWLSNL